MEKAMAKKLSVTIRSDLLDRMDVYAGSNGLSRSGLIAVAVTQYLNAVDTIPSLSKLLSSYSLIVQAAASGRISEDDAKKQMEEQLSLFNSLSGL